ncbi:MAG: heat-inducible transcriptional repressor HrcA [Clostridia bacterium]|nr:heat-inducible transcriptional repressor HrcA [Clostridia bacterium]
MELDARKIRILKAIIDEYIMSASPVGSRFISKRGDFNLSSATIRNEMADLEELGYLEQPHTSAGRVPSDKAYRLYVDHMLGRAQLTNDEIQVIRAHMSSRIDEVEAIIRQTAQALSAVTNYTAMVLPPVLSASRLKHVQLLPLREGRALLVVITNTGFTRDAVIRIPEDMGYEELERISNMLTKRYEGCRMDLVGERIVREMGDELFERREFLNSMVETIERKLSPGAVSVELSGTTNLLHYPEYSDLNKAKSFLAAIEGRDTLYRMLRKASRLEFTITIGDENESEPLKDCSVLTATYRVGDEPLGSFGIIGPTRMHYGKVLSVLEYMRMSLSEMLSNYIEEEKH